MRNDVVWRKSAYSGAGTGQGSDECVEIADFIPGGVPVRDSKSSAGPALRFPDAAWARFVSELDGYAG
ncbi:DUF397 domain-containing protein [Streptomyces sp. UNOC14_S4]|uniref:DUF397 domain-containing protein n=1 Tax=Streptomyces sp. UNOC14_S4 TaxID=2872340 RepID=UPI001E36C8E6|nr:DUF397 domain-containing protein [Streptomyces sp. UNOC14_S4]MCC3771155.1 DUF397 domain-containing protein [Streptomyces sp. UNOC14_S4]